MKKYDYIIIGAGCAGLGLLMRLMDDPAFAQKNVLLIDKDKKDRNDRTWCFWEKQNGYFENIVHKSWNKLAVKDAWEHISLNMNGYIYKMIRGLDFYDFCFKRIATCGNIEYVVADVTGVINHNGTVTITTGMTKLECRAEFVFSAVFSKPTLYDREHYLLQHFKGWMIKTEKNSFDRHEALLMDFSVDQKNYPVAFAYVLPVSDTKALIEYTVFSEAVLDPETYNLELQDYIRHRLGVKEYVVEHTEFGVIPMTNHRFPLSENGIIFIGTAGGQTKASTGYTFQFIQKQATHLAAAIISSGKIDASGTPGSSRFHLYDSIMLRVLSGKKMQGSEVFTRLFKRIPASLIFRFLDNETTFAEEMKIMRAMPPGIFLPAAIREKFKM